MNGIPFIGWRKIVVYLIVLIFSGVSASFGWLPPDALKDVIVWATVSFFGANAGEHISQAWKSGIDIGVVVEKVIETLKNREKEIVIK